MRLRHGFVAVMALCACAFPAHAAAATIAVNTTDDAVADDGHCSLREAINTANSDTAQFASPGECAGGSGTDTISVPAGTFKLALGFAGENFNATGDLDIRSSLTLSGAGAGTTVLDGNGLDRVLDVFAGATVTVQGVTITGGHTPTGGPGGDASGGSGSPGGDASGGSGTAGESGGGIRNDGALTVVDSEITANTTGNGGTGGVGHGGDGTTDLGVPTGGTGGDGHGGNGGSGGSGGGVFSSGGLSLLRVTVSGNTTGSGGIGGLGVGGSGGLGNTTGGNGGWGFGGQGGDGGAGGGVGAASSSSLDIEDSTISANTSGPGGMGGEGDGGPGSPTSGSTGGSGGAGQGGGGGEGAGGGIFTPGPATIVGTLVAGNVAGSGANGGFGKGGDGGGATGGGSSGGDGMFGSGGNGGPSSGGGLLIGSGTLTNVTISGNHTSAGGDGANGQGGNGAAGTGGPHGDGAAGHGGPGGDSGGGGLDAISTTTLTQATVAGNALGAPGTGGSGASGTGGSPGQPTHGFNPDAHAGAIELVLGPITLVNTIVASNSTPSCDAPKPTDGGHNISFPDTTCPGNQVDPSLLALADNGGPTKTQALSPGSPAIDAVPAAGAGCTSTDQRGVTRPFGAGCDIGAFELAPPFAASGEATDVTDTAATLHGVVTPNAGSATYHFEYGTTTAYGSSTPDTAGSGPVAAAIGGLAPGTTYHFRVVATTAFGTAQSGDATFTTAPTPPAGPAPGPGGAAALDTLAPRFLSARLVPARFAVNKKGRSERAVKSRRAKKGTTITFKLSEGGRVVFAVQRALKKKRFGKAVRFAMKAKTGTTRKKFSGRIGKRALKPGRYRLTMVATDAAGNRSRPKRLTFTVVRR
jgi:CSLREA domain-containing protein